MRIEEIFEHVHSQDEGSNCRQKECIYVKVEDPVSFRAKMQLPSPIAIPLELRNQKNISPIIPHYKGEQLR